ncbi:ester hydrolase C11orf54 homolog isoform X2 [Sitodiplosis mosellana]|uniref:ester hydrolase C11orf54 homolog isoform X2 n=1 Tax=Sitodiplosis mosellana TaxID=263140 RepID=UPI002444CD67|nr:ester hydrolase C11orf54 homolog isoform X2 [Sitodiplosis mosellana]
MAVLHSTNFVMVFILVTTPVLYVNCNDVKPINLTEVPWEERELHVPSLRILASALRAGLSKNYADVTVEIQDCPDLTKAPFYLATEGLTGSQTIVDVGGASHLLPVPNFIKVYDFVDIAQKALPNTRTVSIAGAGAGPFMVINHNCEGIYNLQIGKDNGNVTINGKSRIARVLDDGSSDLVEIPSNETRFPFMASLFLSEGQKGQVVHVKAKKRIGKQGSFVGICKNAVRAQFRDKTVGIGGVFVIKNGSAFHHVQPDFSKEPIEDAYKWLKFYNMSSPLIAVGTFVTDAMDVDLNLQHFHSFSQSKWGGHYYNDTTPDTIEYEAYFNVGHRVIRVDRPVN